MNSEAQDTFPHIRDILIEGYRRMSPQQKLKIVTEMTRAVQQLALARIEKQFDKSRVGDTLSVFSHLPHWVPYSLRGGNHDEA